MLDPLGREALEDRVESGDREGDPARAGSTRVQLDEQPGVLVDLPEHLVADAAVGFSPEEPRVPVDPAVEIGYRDTGEQVRHHCGWRTSDGSGRKRSVPQRGQTWT